MTDDPFAAYPKRPDVRQWTFARRFLRPWCWIVGHKPALIAALVPNPHALDSYVLGCARCSAPFYDSGASA